MIDRLCGENAPKLHLVAFGASEDIQHSLSILAKESHGHFHSHTPPLHDTAGQDSHTSQDMAGETLQDSHTMNQDTTEAQQDRHTLCQDTPGEGSGSVQDSDIDRIREEIVRAQRIISELKNLEHGNLGEHLMHTLREVRLSTCMQHTASNCKSLHTRVVTGC